MTAHIRPALPEDGPRCAEIHADSWTWAYTGLIPAGDIAAANARRPGLWARIIPAQDNRSHYVLTDPDTGAVAGFFVLVPTRDEDGDARRCELASIYLDPAYAGRGLGSQAMEWILAEARARGYATITLWVLDRNRRAKGFYAKFGFVPEGAVKPSGLGDTREERLIRSL